MPQDGLILYNDATDNIVGSVTVAYVTEHAVFNYGAYNTIGWVHGFGGDFGGPRPLKHCVETRSSCMIGTVYGDHCSVSAIYVNPTQTQSITINCIRSFRLSNKTPPAGTYAPLVTGANYGGTTLTVGMLDARGTNSADYLWKYLGAFRPRGLSIAAFQGNTFTVPNTPGSPRETVGMVPNSFAVRQNGNFVATMFVESDKSDYGAVMQWGYQGKPYYEAGMPGSLIANAAAVTNSNWEMAYFNAAGARTRILEHIRSANKWDFPQNMQLGAAASTVGFYGAAGVAKQTGTPANATDLATAITLVNALKAQLNALGLTA